MSTWNTVTIKTPAEVIQSVINEQFLAPDPDENYPVPADTPFNRVDLGFRHITPQALLDFMRLAIEADRAQRHPWQVIAEHGKGNPEAIVGHYSSSFEAYAVSDEWNRVNGKHGINYRVEEDV